MLDMDRADRCRASGRLAPVIQPASIRWLIILAAPVVLGSLLIGGCTRPELQPAPTARGRQIEGRQNTPPPQTEPVTPPTFASRAPEAGTAGSGDRMEGAAPGSSSRSGSPTDGSGGASISSSGAPSNQQAGGSHDRAQTGSGGQQGPGAPNGGQASANGSAQAQQGPGGTSGQAQNPGAGPSAGSAKPAQAAPNPRQETGTSGQGRTGGGESVPSQQSNAARADSSGSAVPPGQSQKQGRGLPPSSGASLEPGQLLGQAHQPSSGPEVVVTANSSKRPGSDSEQGPVAEADHPEYADPSTQPAVRMEDLPKEYQEILKDDLSVERLPPEHRQRILHYFRNLRAAASQPALAP